MTPTDPRSILDAVLNALVEPVLVTDADGIVTFVNIVAVHRFGADKDVGRPVVEHLGRLRMFRSDGQPLPAPEHPILRALAEHAAVIGAEMRIEVDGYAGVYVVNTVPLRVGGEAAGTVSVFHDVTGAMRLERELADHAARLRAVVDLVSDGVYVVGAASNAVIFANAPSADILGTKAPLSVEDRARRLRLRTPDGVPLAPEEYPSARALRGETVQGQVCLVTNAAGETRRTLSGAHPLRDRDGNIYAAVVTWKDITAEIRAREEVEAARESAEEANRLKDQFIAALSHELRAPLQPILGWTEVLRRHGNLDPVTAQALDAIRRNVRHQVRLVDDLLDLSRIMHGKLALRFETFDLREQVRAAAEPYEESAALKRIRLTIDLPGRPLVMWGDGARVQQIATNLISNAVKFTPAGGQVAVRLLGSDTEALLEVEDTGEGISPDDLAVIFEVFRQGSTSGRRGGLGIGLDLVRRLTELHGGTVDVHSEGLGYGSRFRVRLPLTPSRALPTPAQAATSRRLHERSILIVEDSADTRDVLKFMLEMEGARVETAACGIDGFNTALAFRPQVVLCDIGLPDIDGLEVARRLRRRPDLDRTRLIALTGYGQSEDVRQAIDAGFEAHLIKPINLDELLALLGRE
ncbi:MAG: PAS domain-containing hybrid sensor histidine kinase/response regulator [Candidatus Rokuibacteriota bacterium]